MVEWVGPTALCQRGLGDAEEERGGANAWRHLTSASSEREIERKSRGGRAREEAVILPHTDRKAHRLQG